MDASTGKLNLNGQSIFVEDRSFNPNRDYLWPVPQAQRDINSQLTQNNGY